MKKLKHCPFCGGTATAWAFNIVIDARIQCDKCGARTKEFNAKDKTEKSAVKKAVKAWNKRA